MGHAGARGRCRRTPRQSHAGDDARRAHGRAGRPAGELARRAGIAPSTASEHLTRLVAGRLLVVESRGRERWYRLASADVAEVLEAMSRLGSESLSQKRWSTARCSPRAGRVVRAECGRRSVSRGPRRRRRGCPRSQACLRASVPRLERAAAASCGRARRSPTPCSIRAGCAGGRTIVRSASRRRARTRCAAASASCS